MLCACHLFAEPVEVLHQPEERRKQEGKEGKKEGRKKKRKRNEYESNQEGGAVMSEQRALVGVIMGSDSDWPVMKEACAVLDSFGVPYEKRVVSAHRTPDLMASYGKEARDRGLRVVIAGAGGAAHLPGMIASHTTLPVIGVPVETRALGGVDSLYSIVQMPNGVPVATVAIGKAANAGLLAVRMLAAGVDELAETLAARLMEYHAQMREESVRKSERLT